MINLEHLKAAKEAICAEGEGTPNEISWPTPYGRVLQVKGKLYGTGEAKDWLIEKLKKERKKG